MTPKPSFSIVTALAVILSFCYHVRLVAAASEQFMRVRSWCSDTDFRPTSSYEKDLGKLLSSLESKANESNGYYAMNTTALGVTTGSDTIYGAFLCRGDISLDSCNACVSVATPDLPPKECPSDKAAGIWYDKCMVRYSNVSFLGDADENTHVLEFWKNQDDVSSLTTNMTGFITLVGNTLTELANQLGSANNQGGSGATKYFGTKNATFSSYITLYTMAQCTPDLTPLDCGRCLNLVLNQMPKYCSGAKGCRVLNPSCYTRYETYPFEDVVSPASPTLPSSLTPPPPLSSPTSPSPSLDANGTNQPLDTNGTSQPSGKSDKTGTSNVVNIALGVLVLFLVVLVAILFYLQCKKRKNNDAGRIEVQPRPTSAPTFESARAELMIAKSLQCDLATLKNATNNFASYNKLGEGGFGSVYKGILPNGQEIAVKRLSKDSSQGGDQFKNEVVFVAKLQHRNLVRLLGYCLTQDEKLLVYEFVPRKSLDLILFDDEKRTKLNWTTRYKIIQGIARGILYLHEDSRLKIVHCDLKASNILLDIDMSPKISDFGLARNFELNQKQDITRRPAGTVGYMAPEYLEYGEFSMQSDVYSFGVLVLEIISGIKISSRAIRSAENLLTYAWKHWNEDTPHDFVDDSLRDSYSRNEVTRCMHIGLLCVQGDIDDRPSMISIVSYLSSDLGLPTPQQPISLTTSRKGSSSGMREQVSDRSKKSGSSSRTSEIRSYKSTSKSTHSLSGNEG